jgi:hypothetical protein
MHVGLTYVLMKNPKRGWAALQRGFKIMRVALGADHPDTVGAIQALLGFGSKYGGSLIAQQFLADFLKELSLEHPQRARLEALQVGGAGGQGIRPGRRER